MPTLRPGDLIDNRIKAIRRYHADAGLTRAELDVSGGVDSAVMLLLLAHALGPENVTPVYSSINSTNESRARAQAVAKVAKVKLIRLDLSGTFQEIVEEALRALFNAGYPLASVHERREQDRTVDGSLRSCLRAPVGRFMSRLLGNGIRHGTGNEDEDRWLRFYQKGGDGEVDTNPLAMLSKGEVYQLAVALGVPREILEALPTPDLWGADEHTDEAELAELCGLDWTYSRVDPITGAYISVGTIERMSRLLDENLFPNTIVGDNQTVGSWVFGEAHANPSQTGLLNQRCVELFEKYDLTAEHLNWARQWEKSSRHKVNPNLPTLGTREALFFDGLVTNELPPLWKENAGT